MPAIRPALLKKQVLLLVQRLDDPPALVRDLHLLFEFYADRAVRPGQATRNRPLTPAYKIRPPVLRQIVQEFEPALESNPQKGLELCESLWEQNYLEFRLLAGMLLGRIPVSASEAILKTIESWVKPDIEAQIITALFDNGLKRLKQEKPLAIIQLAKTFLNQSNLFYQQAGLRALKPVLSDANYENLPAFFRLLQPYVLKINSAIRPDLLDVIAILAKRSPQETAYFLRESLILPDNPDTAWIIRQNLDHFPPKLQTTLREHVRLYERRMKER